MEFKKYNANPKEWKHEGDCVVRAIARATKESWEDVFEDLCNIGKKKCRMPNSPKVYEELLKRIGFIKYSMPKKFDGKRYTIREWVEEHPRFTGVISVAKHLTYVEKGVLIDTWDCSRKSIGNYWVDETGYYEDKENKIVKRVKL
jgi:hypothetical protein